MKKLFNVPVAGMGAVLLLSMGLDASAVTVVDLEFGTGPIVTTNRSADVSTSSEMTINWSADTLLFDGDAALSQDVYAGYSASGTDSFGGATLTVDNGASLMKFIGLNSSTNLSVTQRFLVLWDSDDFLIPGFNSFDDTAYSSLHYEGTIWRGGLLAYRFVIRDGSTYYMSSIEGSTSGAGVSFSINGASEGLQWGAFDPNGYGSFTNTVDAGMGVVFSDRAFTNVTGVGMIVAEQRGSGNNPYFDFSDFRAELVNPSVAASQDTHIRAGVNQGVNYGSDAAIELQKAPEADAQSMIYMGFDLGSVSETITNVTFSLQSPVDYTNTTPYKLYAIDSAAIGPWDESTLTYANAPYTYSNESALASTGLLVAEGTFGAVSSNDTYTISSPILTGFVSSNTTFTLVLTTTDTTLRSFHSTENGTGAISPRLFINPVSYTPPPPRQPLNILFFGNSFTFRNDLPKLVEAVFEEGHPELDVNVDRVVYGGMSMFHHYKLYHSDTRLREASITAAEVEAAIADIQYLRSLTNAPAFYTDYYAETGTSMMNFSQCSSSLALAETRQNNLLAAINAGERTQWDYVVLQAWQDVVDDSSVGYGKYAEILANIAEEEGIKVILYVPAPYAMNATPVSAPIDPSETVLQMQTVRELAERIQPTAVVPVALGLEKMHTDGTDLNFRYVNDFHPNPYCAFLTAHMFHAAFFGESSAGFTHFDSITDTPLTPPEINPDGGDSTVYFDEATKLVLQQAAYYGAVDFTRPAAPTGLTALFNEGSVDLDWADNAESDLASYSVYRSTTSGSYGDPLITGLTNSAYSDASLNYGTTYYYVVTAVDSEDKESDASDEVSYAYAEETPATIDMIGNTTGAAGGEFADYTVLGASGYYANWDDSVVNDGMVSLAVGDLALDNTDSPAQFLINSYAGANAEINFAPIATGVTNAATALSKNAFIAIKLDSTAFDSESFKLDSVSVSLWRSSTASATTYQLAYDSDGDGYTADDLLGSPVVSSATGSGNPFTVSAALSTDFATQQEVRLYFWDIGNSWQSTHLYEVEAAYTHTASSQDSFSLWSETFGGTNVIGSTADDYDGDGLSNFLEYALNGNPTNNAEKGVFRYGANSSAFTFVHAKHINDDLMSYRLLERTNLVEGVVRTNTWTSQSFGPVAGNYVTVSNHYDTSTNKTIFIQLVVERAP